MLSSWSTCCLGISQRWIFAVMAFLGLWIGNGLRVALSITITEMTLPITETTNQLEDSCVTAEPKEFVSRNANVTIVTGKLYDWDEYTQGIILSSYFWGYVFTQFPAGTGAERYGGKYFLGLSIFVPALLTFLTPSAVEYGGATALVIVRVLMGLASGAMYPAASAMLPRWTAPSERTKFGSIVYAGGLVGTVCGTTMSALIIRYSNLGWPGVFHVFGAIGMAWFPIWAILVYNSPKKHPFISEAELKYLEESSERKRKPPPPPYAHILRSMPCWAFVIALYGCDWAYFTMASDLPKYMSSVVGMPIEQNGYLSSIPYLGAWLCSILCFWLVDRLIATKWLSLLAIRKILTSITLVGPGVFILAASYAECDRFVVVVMFVCGVTLMGIAYSSIFLSPIDLCPNYSGTLMAIGNGIAALGGICTPYVVGVLTPNQTIGEWRLVFWIVFATAVLSCAFFLVYGSAEVQPWNDPDFLRKPKKEGTTVEEKGTVAYSTHV